MYIFHVSEAVSKRTTSSYVGTATDKRKNKPGKPGTKNGKTKHSHNVIHYIGKSKLKLTYVAKSKRRIYCRAFADTYLCGIRFLNIIEAYIENWIYANCKTKIRVRTKNKNHTSSKGRMNRRAQRVKSQSKITPLLVAPFVCMTATAATDQVQRTHFDTDSILFGLTIVQQHRYLPI